MDEIKYIFRSLFLLLLCYNGQAQVVNVNTASQLQSALNAAQPGQTIQIADGYYERSGGFYAVAGIDGTAANPITVIGSRNAILSTGTLNSSYGFSLKGNKYWVIKGFTIITSSKGVVLDSCQYITLDSLQVKKTGGEAIHLRTYSSYCTVKRCYIDSTGLNDYSFGEGIYIGSAYSNWCTYTDCNIDTCNYNQVLNNSFGNFVTAENVDIKEGTKYGIVSGNTFNGTGLQGMNGGDSWIDAKGNYYTIENNIGNNSILDGIQTHIAQPGWGNYNTFRNNVLNVNGSGYGIRVQTSNANGSATGNIVCTNNIASGAGLGMTNVTPQTCTPLSIQLLNWNAVLKNQKLVFTWQVTSVNNVSAFIIEHSNDGINFSKLAEVAKRGTIYKEQLSYSSSIGKYLRLVIVQGLNKTYSKIIYLDGKALNYKVNINGNQLVILYPQVKGFLQLYNGIGQSLKKTGLKQGYNYVTLDSSTKLYVVNILNESPTSSYSNFLIRN